MRHGIRYGKHNVSFYRTHPTRGLLAGRVNIDVFGDNFLPAYTEGDNREVVATDTMKNFVYAMALEYPGASHEGFAAFLGRRLLATYPQMQSLRLLVEEIPFAKHSAKLLSPLDDDYGTVELEIEPDRVRSLRCGRRNLRLVKLTGSAFKDFARDAYTTLPERSDRPLFIHLDVHWRYRRMEDGTSDGPARIASEAVRDAVITGLRGRELEFLQRLLASDSWLESSADRAAILTALARCVVIEAKPKRVSQYATEQPPTPPPMTTASARSFKRLRRHGHSRRLGCDRFSLRRLEMRRLRPLDEAVVDGTDEHDHDQHRPQDRLPVEPMPVEVESGRLR